MRLGCQRWPPPREGGNRPSVALRFGKEYLKLNSQVEEMNSQVAHIKGGAEEGGRRGRRGRGGEEGERGRGRRGAGDGGEGGGGGGGEGQAGEGGSNLGIPTLEFNFGFFLTSLALTWFYCMFYLALDHLEAVTNEKTYLPAEGRLCVLFFVFANSWMCRMRQVSFCSPTRPEGTSDGNTLLRVSKITAIANSYDR